MKIFERDGKINFVDENNVVLGFDYGQSCCEHYGYRITEDIPNMETYADDIESVNFKEEDYRFDPEFIRIENAEDGNVATFKLRNKDKRKKKPLYLTIFNYHNGWYSHGFTFTVDGIIKVEDYL